MTYLSKLSESEIKYVCSIIPLQISLSYFKKNPKEFGKIMPGFRTTSIKNQKQVSDILFKNYTQPFVVSFLEGNLKLWIKQIQSEISRIIDNGESKESAWIKTLPFCFFVDSIEIFFKLIGEVLSEEYLSLLFYSIKEIKKISIENKNNMKEKELEYDRLSYQFKEETAKNKKLNNILNDKEKIQIQFNKKIEHISVDLEKADKKLIEYSEEIRVLRHKNTILKQLEADVNFRKKRINNLEEIGKEYEQKIQQLKQELSLALSEQQRLEVKIRNELEQEKANKLIGKLDSIKPKRPKDMDEFSDYLGYNLESLGMEVNKDYYFLLKDYLSEILFTGKPILVSRNTCLMLMKCISNTLVSSENVAKISYTADISECMIDNFLSAKNRIMCLDNFIGNFDESILSVICERHKNKIIFLTTSFDKNLQYVPQEFFKYCYYLNINRIHIFNQEQNIIEPPSFIEEIESLPLNIIPDERWSLFLKEVLREFGLSKEFSVYKSSLVLNELSLCRILAFDILPYCTDVLNISPFNVSERLNKYIGDNGRCSYKLLFRRWFN